MELVQLNVLGKLEKFKIKYYRRFAKVKMLVKMSIWWATNDGKNTMLFEIIDNSKHNFRLPQPKVSFHMDEINKFSLKIKLFC